MTQFNIHIASGDVADDSTQPSDATVENSPTLRFRLIYPLTNAFEFVEKHADGCGWTEREIVNAITRAYHTVYDEEHASVADPGHMPQSYNRGRSNGPYGIWGHDIGDLILTKIEPRGDGVWEIDVES